MAGFAAILGGAGQGLQQTNQQIRSILEQRREGLANLLTQAAGQEGDPGRRGELLQHAADTLSGKPMGGIAQGVFKTVQAKQQDDEKLGQVTKALGLPQGPGQPQPQPAGPAGPGQTPGSQGLTSGPGAAAQPASSPVQGGNDLDKALNGPGGPGGVPQLTPPPTAGPAASVAPAASAAGAPSPFDVRAKRDEIIQRYTPMFQQATPAMRPFIQAQMTQELGNLQPLEQVALRQQQFDQFRNSPEFQALPDFAKAGYAAQAGGLQPVNIPFSFLQPHNMGRTMPSTGIPDNERLDQFGQQIPADKFPYVTEIFQGGQRFFAPGTGPMQTVADPETNQLLRVPGAAPGPMTTPSGGNAVPPSAAFGVRNTGVDPRTLSPVFQSPAQLLGVAPGSEKGAGVNVAAIPRVSTSMRSISTMDANGNPVTQLVPVTTTSRRGGTGGTSAPASASAGTSSPGASFPKALAPGQREKLQESVGQVNIALERVRTVQNGLPLLNSMIDSGKLQLETNTDGVLKAVVNRNLPLTESEAKFIGAFNNMAEDINLLRGPMGATGFRGPEAFGALQAQRGQLLANPKVTKEVLNGTIKALQSLQKTRSDALKNPNTLTPAPSSNPSVDELLKRHGIQ
jgi:hypothetical protein